MYIKSKISSILNHLCQPAWISVMQWIPVALVLSLSLISCKPSQGSTERSSGFIEWVDPFIGTGGHGHTFPGATVPNGMVQLSPDSRVDGWDACSGYHISDSAILGFSHTHLSGTGIGDYGDVLFMPTVGTQMAVPGSAKDPDAGYASRKSKGTEVAYPGYYSVVLDDYDVKVELTATQRTGFHRYHYPEGDAGLIIDLGHTIHGHKNIRNELEVVNDREIRGVKMTEGWAKEHVVYFHAVFSSPFSASILKEGSFATLKFMKHPGTLEVKVGISSVDYRGAKNNLDEENPDWNFGQIAAQASAAWEALLSKVKVTGGSKDQKTIFYTAMYHAGLAPYTFSDVDGRYVGMDREIRQSDRTIYTVFSLWDTFRAYHPMNTIIKPAINQDMINSLLVKYDEGGILPKWELAGNYTGTMIGYHAVSVIVDAYMKGQRNFDVEKAYEAILHATKYDTTTVPFHTVGVAGQLMPMGKYYNESMGFIPADLENESVSKALEYAYNDWCIAQMAKDLGKSEDYNYFMERSKRYARYFDEETGFMRGKLSTGGWREPFNPKFSQHRKDDYTEGNAWQYTWFVPHDVEGLVALFGGEAQFSTKLDQLFSESSEIEGEGSSVDISGLIGQYAHGNEPSHHIAYLYNYIGEPWKTQEVVDKILTTLYFNDPNGLSGNEDCGQMSSWYVLSAMGIYQVAPGSTTYTLGRPIFDHVELNLENGKTFEIVARNNSPESKYVKTVSLNGQKLERPFLDHSAIESGGKLEFEMTHSADQ